MNSTTVLWIYIGFLLLGGLIGFIKAGSKISLMVSSAFAVILALTALAILPPIVGPITIGFLLLFFGSRFAKTKKFMPGGLMSLLSIAALVLLLMNR